MDNQEVIREQMEDTRSSLSEKLESLEETVATTVKGATKDVTQTVENVTESVQESVAAVTDAVQDTVASVKDTVAETLTAVKQGVSTVGNIFDVPRHVDRHPWAMMGGSVFVGYLLGEYLLGARASGRNGHRPPSRAPAIDEAETPAISNGKQNGHQHGTEAKEEGFLARFEPDLAKLKGLALGVLMGTARDMIVKAAGHNLGHSVSEIIDSITEKMGGKPVPPEPAEESPSEMGETAGAALTV